jgi:hypothetical protein
MADLTLAREAIAVLLVAAAHLFAGRIEQAAGRELHRLISFAGGIAVGYVFVALLPKIGLYTSLLVEAEPRTGELGRVALYLFGLLGFLVYFAADRYHARNDGRNLALALHGLVFAAYSALVGYLIAHAGESRTGYVPHIAVGVVMGVHVFAVDHQLRHWHGAAYDRVLRHVFVAAVVAGWAIGRWVDLPKSTLAIWTSILAGGILVNVFSEEFPRGGRGDAWSFLAGVVAVVVVAAVYLGFSEALH